MTKKEIALIKVSAICGQYYDHNEIDEEVLEMECFKEFSKEEIQEIWDTAVAAYESVSDYL